MKVIKLDHASALSMMSGKKRSTWRMFDDKQLAVGDTIQLIDKVDPEDESTWHTIGCGVINIVIEKRIRDITESDYEGHEEYVSHEEIVEQFKHYYGDSVTIDTPLKIVQFSLVDCERVDEKVVKKSSNLTEVKLFTDGGSRGNPGPSALGYVVKDTSDTIIKKGAQYLGITTNNQAEYQAVKAGLMACAQITNNTVGVYLDSQLVAHQMNGIYKIKNRELWPIHQSIKQLCEENFKKVTFTHVPRELNKDADAMVNEALDAYENEHNSV